MYPETDDCAQKLLHTLDANRYEYIKALFDQLISHLTDKQAQNDKRFSLTYLYSATHIEKNPRLIEAQLFSLRKKLEAELLND